MGEAFRPRVDGIAGNQAGVAWVRAQVAGQAVRNMGQVGQWQPMSRIMPGNGYLKGVDSVNPPRTALRCPWARVDHHPRRRYGRFAARPARVRRRVAVQDEPRENHYFVARSQLWLHEVSPVLGYMNPVMGVNSEYQIFIGNVAPTGSEVAEGGAHSENNPTVTRLRRTPTIIHYPWSLTGNLSAMDEVGLGSLFENGVQGLILERATRAILSGPNTDSSFAANANSFDGLFASGLNLTPFGANTDTSITGFGRAVVTAAESQLRKNNATGDNLFWILSNAMVEVAVDKRIGGTDAIVFLAQRDPKKFREGLIGGTTAGLGSHYVETGELGRPHGTTFKQTAIGICGFGSQMVPIFFGQGIEFRLNRLTDTTNTNYSLQMALSYVQANTKNAEAVGQAVS